MQPIHTLHDFFIRSGASLTLYHLGRRLAASNADELAELETGKVPWPFPWKGEARLACIFTLGNRQDPIIWFLALPLDEHSQLLPGPRDAFLQRLLETLGHSASDTPRNVDNLMKDNPLAFTPSLPMQAMLHAHASRDLGQPASQHYELAEAYLTGELSDQPWQSLGLQGIADVVARLDDTTSAALASRLVYLPVDVLRPLCDCLAHVVVNTELAKAIRARGDEAAHAGDIETFCACVRAIGQGPSAIAASWYHELLDDPAACGPDLFAAIAARGWEHLEDEKRLPLFLTRVAENPDADFSALARDLAMIPRLRLPVLMSLRGAEADSAIGNRLAQLHRPD
ncbi:DUF3549 family protein [Aidingimonas lacisalsi]|uniref:DUF3549 family protein n=1 Tax=Aidingimonas lacisalsi TaxID=2604086 RepID=UPI0011D1C73D|nr:DUF3549 family protein [Aidingimonas lacisalsi]